MTVRIRNNITAKVKRTIRSRFTNLIDELGGAKIVSLDSQFSYGYIRTILGSTKRIPSPSLIVSLLSSYKDEIDDRFTKEFLRPDVTAAQWRIILDSLNKENE